MAVPREPQWHDAEEEGLGGSFVAGSVIYNDCREVDTCPVQWQAIFDRPAPRAGPPLPEGLRVQGARLDYFSPSLQCWIPALALEVEPETGAVTVQADDQRVEVPLDGQGRRLRPRRTPSLQQLDRITRLLGGVEDFQAEARALVARYERQGPEPWVPLACLHLLANDVDVTFGCSGAALVIRDAVNRHNATDLQFVVFQEALWSLLTDLHLQNQAVQQRFGAGVPSGRAALEEEYDLGDVLGHGTFGQVRVATEKATGRKRAIKSILKDHLQADPTMLEAEIRHLSLVDHPHIVRLHAHYEDETSFHLAMDFCSGGALEERLQRARHAARPLADNFVFSAVQQVLLAVAHIHARGALHLDLKPANVMLSRPQVFEESRPHVLVIDLGVAQMFRPGMFTGQDPRGSPMTMAPEVWKGELTPKADVFSTGCILFELLTLAEPFNCPYQPARALAYWSRQPAPPSPPWQLMGRRSPEVREACQKMLAYDRRSRPTAVEALQLPLFASRPPPPRPAGLGAGSLEATVRRLGCANSRSVLYWCVAATLARSLPQERLAGLRGLFQQLDVGSLGQLDTNTVAAFLLQNGVQAEVAGPSATAMDRSRSGTIGWSEFVAAALDFRDQDMEAALRAIFCAADYDGNGSLSLEELAGIMRVSEATVRFQMLELVGMTAQEVDWNTFVHHFQGPEV